MPESEYVREPLPTDGRSTDLGWAIIPVFPGLSAISGFQCALRVRCPQIPHQHTTRIGNENPRGMTLLQTFHHTFDECTGAGCRRSVTHHRFDDRVGWGFPGISMEESEDDPFLIEHDADIPSPVAGSRPYPTDLIVEITGGNIPTHDIADPENFCFLSFGGKPIGNPVHFSGFVHMDVGESEANEPPRGPDTEVSLHIPAIDDHGIVLAKTLGRRLIQFA